MSLLWIISLVTLANIASLILASAWMFLAKKPKASLLQLLISYATGTLLGAALLGLLPHALNQAPVLKITTAVLGGLLLFFILEKLILWHHCHRQECEIHSQAGLLILVGDALHNFVDGAVIAAAFMTSPLLGISTALAVMAHEIPQEIGDFAILLASGYSRRKAFLYNLISGSTALVGALLVYAVGTKGLSFAPYIMAVSAASFIYIAIADLIPEMHKQRELKASFIQLALILSGVATIALFSLRH